MVHFNSGHAGLVTCNRSSTPPFVGLPRSVAAHYSATAKWETCTMLITQATIQLVNRGDAVWPGKNRAKMLLVVYTAAGTVILHS